MLDDDQPKQPPLPDLDGLRRRLRWLLTLLLAAFVALSLIGVQRQVNDRFESHHRLVQQQLLHLAGEAGDSFKETLLSWVRAQNRPGIALSLDVPIESVPFWLNRHYPLFDPQGRVAADLYLAVDLAPLLRRQLPLWLLALLVCALLYYGLGRAVISAAARFPGHFEALRQELQRLTRERNLYRVRSQQSKKAFHHIAFYDLLTDLPSRLKLMEVLEEHLERAEVKPGLSALISLDLQNFQEINESLGHRLGDQVLIQVAERLRQNLKRSDLVARLGGDEFAVLLVDIPSRNVALEVCQRILRVLEQPLEVEGVQFDVQAAIGVAFYPDHATESHELIRRSDTAMYRAKMRGGGVEVYDPGEESAFAHRLTLKHELRRAIENGNLQVYFQPKINMDIGRITGVECLVRWIHPERGFIGPDQFVPLAERSNLIHPMTGLVFNVALYQCRRWLDEGMEIGVAVNCSAQSLADEHLPQRIKALLYTWGVPAHLFTLEVTESTIMTHPEQALAVLERLHQLGIHLSVDDFGTGYSSLSYLKSMPVSELKIDRSFVSDMLTDENDAVIVRATIDMAHDLGLKVTAEGIEDQATWDALVELGCDRAQGFFMGKPQPAQELARWLRESPFGLEHPPQAKRA